MENYQTIRSLMKPGDLVAFGGKGAFSDLIKNVTRSPVSHVGVVWHRRPLNGVTNYAVELVESTSLYDVIGVQITRMSTHMENYGGEIWWIPLSEKHKAKMNHNRFFQFIEKHLGKPYDFKQAVGSALDLFDRFFENKEDYTKFFCSEFYAAAHKHAGTISMKINPSEQTPIDVCKWAIYREAVQLSGEEKEIPGFNTIEV